MRGCSAGGVAAAEPGAAAAVPLLLALLLASTPLPTESQGAVTMEAPPRHILESGHANWTSKKLKKFLKKPGKALDAVMVGFSAASCGAYCLQFEGVYEAFTEMLTEELPSVQFVRIDADAEKSAVLKHEVGTLPAILTFKKGRKTGVPYTGVHDLASLGTFARKLTQPTLTELTTEEDVRALLRLRSNATVVLGFFGSRSSDEYSDWVAAAEDMTLRADMYPPPAKDYHQTRHLTGILPMVHFPAQLHESHKTLNGRGG